MSTEQKTYPSQFEKVKAITDHLEAGIQVLFESDKFKQYLKTLSKFHDYSLNNTILIAMQKSDATLVAGYTAWQKRFGRQVQKGENGIRILAPTPYKKRMEVEKTDPVTGEILTNPDGTSVKETKEVLMPAFKVVNVFDVSQTDGKPLPTLGVNELTGDVAQYEMFFETLKKACPVPMGFEQIEGGAKGYFHTVENRIAIQEGMSQVQTVKTAIHEMTHQKLHSIDPTIKVDPLEPKITRNHKELKASLDKIRKTASEMITEIDEHLAALQKELGIEVLEPPSALADLQAKKEKSEKGDIFKTENKGFSEEMNLIRAMDHTCRRMAIFDIKTSIPNIEDHELKELCKKALKKMSAMTDADFAAIDLTVYEEDEENE